MIRKNSRKTFFVAGIDEAGRGPLAGPISVGVVATTLKSKFQFAGRQTRLLKNIRDSKKLSAAQREKWFEIIKNNFEYKCSMVSSRVIDKIGIQKATELAVTRALKKLSGKPDLVLLDGALFAPKNYNQKTIIKGDEKVPLISAASIVAKVSRDKRMLKLHKVFPHYAFNKHKGYGTKLHYEMIKKNGVSPEHRKSYLKRLVF